jgi:hypothetical protein
MTAPGGGNFFSKAARRAAKAISPGTGFESADDGGTAADSTPPRKTSGFQTVHYDPPGHEARKAVEGAERETATKHGKMKK